MEGVCKRRRKPTLLLPTTTRAEKRPIPPVGDPLLVRLTSTTFILK